MRRREGDGPWNGSTLRAFGARFALAGDAAGELAPALAAALPGAFVEPATAAPRPDVVYRLATTGDGDEVAVHRDGSEIARGTPDEVLAHALDALHFDVALHAREASFLHASVVRLEGRLILFPGRTGAGKSTLAACLAARGATYYSDEYAPIDGEGRILPYPKAISLRPDVRERFAAGAGGHGGEAAAPDAIVFTRFRAGARFRPRPVRVEAAALALVDNSVVAEPRPHQAAAAVARLLAHQPRLGRGARGEAEELAVELARWLAAPP